MKVDGTINKFKARLVIQGFRQKEGINYFDTYAPVARITTIRLLLALDSIHNLVIHQMDVKTTFLNGDLDEEVYMKQPEGFVMPSNDHKVNDYLILCAYELELSIPFVHRVVLLELKDVCIHSTAIQGLTKKQTCITVSTMEYEFVALVVAGIEAEWLRNLIHEIPTWPKLIAPISIRCDSVLMMAKAYSQVYNGKSRHLGASMSKTKIYHPWNMKFCRFKKLGRGFPTYTLMD
ncbi:zinc finger, CCHC-type containing protein [Tanacetum coccineum]|uniref:Zinc finger, CCHC-type containing protein n=1 Tax=Tanacetum coccineum TaxID=301880 RepID=A0ABQ5CWA7_9ASTR